MLYANSSVAVSHLSGSRKNMFSLFVLAFIIRCLSLGSDGILALTHPQNGLVTHVSWRLVYVYWRLINHAKHSNKKKRYNIDTTFKYLYLFSSVSRNCICCWLPFYVMFHMCMCLFIIVCVGSILLNECSYVICLFLCLWELWLQF